MFLPHRSNQGVRVTLTSRVPEVLRRRLEARAAASGLKLSAVVAELLEVALDFEKKLQPFHPAIQRLMREERLSVTEAVLWLLWMDVELDAHQEVPGPATPASASAPPSARGSGTELHQPGG